MHISASIGISPYMYETEGPDEMLAKRILLSIGPRTKAATNIASIRRTSIVRCAIVSLCQMI